MNIPNGKAYAGCNLQDGARVTIRGESYVYDELTDWLNLVTQAKASLAKATKPSKYRNAPTVIDGIRFSSKAEARYYAKLKLLKESGDVEYFLMQTTFHLCGGIRYVCDFAIKWNGKEGMTFVDVKGVETAMFKLKKKLVESQYPVTIILEK